MLNIFPRCLALVLSYIFNPILIPIYALLNGFLYKNCLSQDLRNSFIILIVFITTVIIPIVKLIILFKFNLIGNLDLAKRQDRFIPILINTLYYGILSFSFWGYYGFTFPTSIIFIIFLCLLVAYIITLYYKVSIHTLGVGCLLGEIIGLQYICSEFLPILLILYGFITLLIFIARFKLKAHSFLQICLGFILGLTVSISIILIL